MSNKKPPRSLRSSTSKHSPPHFSGEAMQSDVSKHSPPHFSGDATQSDVSKHSPPHFSGDATQSDVSKHSPPHFSGDATRSDPKQTRKRPSGHRVISEKLQKVPIKRVKTEDEVLKRVIGKHKASLKKKFQNISEGITQTETQTLLNKIYTELYITVGEGEGVNKEHEVWQLESASRVLTTEDTSINCNDIFRSLPGQEKHIRAVMTKGVAGIGKTVSVQKFILDWIDGLANQHVDFIFPLPFRELNLIRNDQHSLHKLLLDFHPELKELDDDEYKDCQIVFIFDGLDESRLTLDFEQNMNLSGVKTISSVDALLTGLIRGNLLSSAPIWITSRPAAASQIPVKFIDQVTEIRGFNDSQKEEYFKKKIRSESLATRVITHIKASMSLHIMCHIPVFCWITATVLQQMLQQENTQEIPKSLTEMFIHFLIIQSSRRHEKYQAKSDREIRNPLKSQEELIFRLSDLAFKHLQRGNFMFLEEEVKECGLDVTDVVVQSGLCTDVFKEETIHFGKVYTFVHITIQEFLAALHMFASYMTKNEEVLKLLVKEKSSISPKDMSLDELLKNAVNRALESKNGHLDLFVRFLHGISMESNQRLLQGFLKHIENNPESIEKTIKNLKELNRPNISPDRWINLLHCLVEMHDSSVHEEVQTYMNNAQTETQKLKLAHCSAVAKILLMSEKPVEELDLKKYKTSDEGRRRLIPAVRNCERALLADCKLTEKSCAVVALALESVHLKVLDLSKNDLQPSEEKIFRALQSQQCKLETLRLVTCKLSGKSCKFLAAGLESPSTALRELDLSDNNLKDSVIPIFSAIPNCKLEKLRIAGCRFTASSCKALASALQVPDSPLRELDLSRNPLKDSGVEILSTGLKSLHCCLEKLRLSACEISGKGCQFLASALTSNPSYLSELELRDNQLGEEGLEMLLAIKDNPNTALVTLTNGCSPSPSQ